MQMECFPLCSRIPIYHCHSEQHRLAKAFIRGSLTCTNKLAQADEQKIARNEGFLALPAMHQLLHVFNVGPKWVFSFSKIVRENITFSLSWNFLHFREREEVAESFRQCTFSFGSSSLFDFGSGDCSGGPQDAEMAFQLCTFVGAK